MESVAQTPQKALHSHSSRLEHFDAGESSETVLLLDMAFISSKPDLRNFKVALTAFEH